VESKDKPWWVYIVECNDGSLYTGITVNVENRISVHNSGKGAKYTKTRRPVNLRVSWLFENRSAAAKEEWRIKQLSRAEKLLL
jgi:putative endonuclease